MKAIILGLACFFTLSTYSNSQDNFKDAKAAWTFSDFNDKTQTNSLLKCHGDIKILELKDNEKRESAIRGGDGLVAVFEGAWFDAGQGFDNELNLSGKDISILVRMKADVVEGFVPLINKAGNDQNIAYSIYLNKIGEEIYIESKIGSDDIGGAHLLRSKMNSEDFTKWHDIIFRFNGKKSELFVDGILRDDEVTVGEIRDWNRRPVLIGAQYKQPYGYATVTDSQVDTKFAGLMDHVVLWDRYLSENEVMKLSGVDVLKDGKPVYYSETYRPQFHFSAKKNWINDPNGLVFYDGTYHLFFQYMPPHRPGAYKDWGHAVSKDLVHWKQINDHITPHKVWAGCWSGSAVVDFDNSAGFQTGEDKTIIAFITNGGNPNAGIGPKCTQCIAYSTDGGMTFTYYDQNPVIPNIYESNRDPKVVWDEDSQKWIMSLYMDKGNDFGLFSSSDLKKWDHLTTVTLEGVAECPGFLPLPVDGNNKNKRWLFYGANGNYMLGTFDGKNFKSETKVVRADYGKNFYAAQTWSDVPDGRCIHIAWMPTKRYPGMPFEQQMNFPTELTLKTTPDGIRVYRMPVKEISLLYNKEKKWENVSLKKGNNLFKDLRGDLFDISLETDQTVPSSFDIVVRGATIRYDAEKNIISCGGPSVENNIIPADWKSDKNSKIDFSNNLGQAPLSPENGRVKLRILVDRTTVEIFGNDGKVVITSCFMPKENDMSYSLTTEKKVKIVCAEVHSIKSAW